MAARLNAADLSPAQRKALGLRLPRKTQFDKEAVRRHALHVLAAVAQLTQDQRRRVLEHAQKINRL